MQPPTQAGQRFARPTTGTDGDADRNARVARARTCPQARTSAAHRGSGWQPCPLSGNMGPRSQWGLKRDAQHVECAHVCVCVCVCVYVCVDYEEGCAHDTYPSALERCTNPFHMTCVNTKPGPVRAGRHRCSKKLTWVQCSANIAPVAAPATAPIANHVWTLSYHTPACQKPREAQGESERGDGVWRWAVGVSR